MKYPYLRYDCAFERLKDGRYAIENAEEERYIVSGSVFRKLVTANGLHPITFKTEKEQHICQKLMDAKILSNNRWIYHGLGLSSVVILPLGAGLRVFRKEFRTINLILSLFSPLLFLLGMYMARTHSYALMGGDFHLPLYFLLLLASVLFHEVGHTIAGTAYGLTGISINAHLFLLFPFAFSYAHLPQAELGERSLKQSEKIQLYLAGIEMNLLLAGLFLALGSTIFSDLGFTLMLAASVNVLLVIVNALPVFSLDGERALSALLNIDSVSKYAKKIFLKKERQRMIHGGTGGRLALCMCALISLLKCGFVIYMFLDVLSLGQLVVSFF